MADASDVAGVAGAALNVVVGLYGLLRSGAMARAVGLAPAATRGLTEMRVTFGALWVALGMVLLARPTSGAFALAGTLWAALAIARIVFAVSASHLDKPTFTILAVEIVAAALLLGAANL